jgi:ParB-like chromosome segregation protein Spo0J
MKKLKWQTVKKKLGEISLLKDNPRYISDEEMARLEKDIAEVGHFKPLIVSKDLHILGGNQRYKYLLQKHGEDGEVLVSIPNRELTEEERKKVILLDNYHRGHFDIQELSEKFKVEVGELDLDIDIEIDDYLPSIKDTDVKKQEIEQAKETQAPISEKHEKIDIVCPYCHKTIWVQREKITAKLEIEDEDN